MSYSAEYFSQTHDELSEHFPCNTGARGVPVIIFPPLNFSSDFDRGSYIWPLPVTLLRVKEKIRGEKITTGTPLAPRLLSRCTI